MTPIPGCAAHVTLATLSAWRDQDLSEADARQAERHIHDCRACQAQIANFDRVGRLVRDHTQPDFQEPLWRDVLSHILEQRRADHGRRGLVVGGLGAALAGVIVLALVFVVFNHPGGHISAQGTPRGTLGPTATATFSGTVTPGPASGSGWKSYTLPGAGTLAFAPSAPTSAYSCGSANNKTLSFATSLDGGHSWQVADTGIQANSCQIAVSPGEPHVIVIATNGDYCQGDGCVTLDANLYLTQNGGTTWAPLALPSGVANVGITPALAWVGTTLFIGAQVNDPTQPKLPAKLVLLASQQGAPLASFGQAQLANLSATLNPQFYALKATLFVRFGSAYYTTNPAATSLTPVTFTTNNRGVDLLTASQDGQTLIGTWAGQNEAAPPIPETLLSSSDQGRTWNILPGFASTFECCEADYTFGAPNGAIIAELRAHNTVQNNYPAQGIYELAPGATTWRFVASSPNGTIVSAISVNAAGQPVAVWALNDQLNGYAYHTISP